MARAKAHHHKKNTVSDDEIIEHWMQSKWRPLMAITYMLTCLCDFIIFPVLWSILQAKDHGVVTSQWQPITLISGGFYHLAMGAIVGISAWGRTQEKVNGVSYPMAMPQPSSSYLGQYPAPYGSTYPQSSYPVNNYPQASYPAANNYPATNPVPPVPYPAAAASTNTAPVAVPSTNIVPQHPQPEL
jgi:hypothetical protein